MARKMIAALQISGRLHPGIGHGRGRMGRFLGRRTRARPGRRRVRSRRGHVPGLRRVLGGHRGQPAQASLRIRRACPTLVRSTTRGSPPRRRTTSFRPLERSPGRLRRRSSERGGAPDPQGRAGKEHLRRRGPTLVTSLLNEGLLDELRLIVHPILGGGGKALFRRRDSPACTQLHPGRNRSSRDNGSHRPDLTRAPAGHQIRLSLTAMRGRNARWARQLHAARASRRFRP